MMEVRSVSAVEVRPLRRALLRPGANLELSIYPRDNEPSTLHLGLYDGETIVGVATNQRAAPWKPESHSWRLRGMAVHEKYRNRGEGTKMLEFCIAYVNEADGEELWCNGRVAARGFYEREGFKIKGAQFEVPISGPHYLFVKKL